MLFYHFFQIFLLILQVLFCNVIFAIGICTSRANDTFRMHFELEGSFNFCEQSFFDQTSAYMHVRKFISFL